MNFYSPKGKVFRTKVQDLRFDEDRKLKMRERKKTKAHPQRKKQKLASSGQTFGPVETINKSLCSRNRPLQTYCGGFCGPAAAEARLLAVSLAFSDAPFTVSLSGRWGVSPVGAFRQRERTRRSEDNVFSLALFRHGICSITGFIELLK